MSLGRKLEQIQLQLSKRERQMEDLVRRNNDLIRMRDMAQVEAGRYLLALQDIAFAPKDQQSAIAQRAIDSTITPKLNRPAPARKARATQAQRTNQ